MEGGSDKSLAATDQILSCLQLQVDAGFKQLKSMVCALQDERNQLKEKVQELENQNAQLLHSNNDLIRILEDVHGRLDASASSSLSVDQTRSHSPGVQLPRDEPLPEKQDSVTSFAPVYETVNSSNSTMPQDVFVDTMIQENCVDRLSEPARLSSENNFESESHVGITECTAEELTFEDNAEEERNGVRLVDLKQKREDLPCAECDKTFLNVSDLERHSRMHDSEKPFLCKECGHRFTLFGSLKRHLEGHTGSKSYNCDKCGQRFTRLHNMKRHQVLHSQETVFKCDYCARKYKHSEQLEKHLLTHSSVKQFPCTFCKRGFTSSASLKIHLRSHSNEKPYKCKLCGETFIRMVTLRKHESSHHTTSASF